MAATATEATDSGNADASQQAAGEAPSGFILKLYQMVNGAPDEVIAWTPSGDAFIIGSDLARLEAETLPQYFRHNRFQSLVRQLNFYSFRKINRERNMWIYKHSLFHRDRPDDLHLVRRRTCPGMDGRKQRFSSRKVVPDVSKSDDDASSVESPKTTEVSVPKKRNLPASQRPTTKRGRRIWNGVSSTNKEKNVNKEKDPVVVDKSMLDEDKTQPKVVETTVEPTILPGTERDRVEMVEQSMIVSEVSMKLEQFARKAKGRYYSRTRSGLVTPPYGDTFSASNGILTYDDEEYGYQSDDDNAGRRDSGSSFGVVTESEASSLAGEDSVSGEKVFKNYTSAPVNDPRVADAITQRLLAGSPMHTRLALVAPIAVAGFCMLTPPSGDKDLCSKILQLLASCQSLLSEFQKYRAALEPSEPEQEPPTLLGVKTTKQYRRALTVQQIWERSASRDDAVRDFKIFAVNCIRKILVQTDGDLVSMTLISNSDRAILENTVDMWAMSVGLAD